ncbi:MAG: hypothetical protein R2854_14420 [Caldilineaceae bacterium]
MPAPYAFGSFVHEEVADHSHPWPRRLLAQMDWNPEDVERRSIWQGDWHAPAHAEPGHQPQSLPHAAGVTIVQVLDASGCDGPLVQRVFVPQDDAHVEFSAQFRLGLDAHPQATYLAFPWTSPAQARIDLGGQAMEPGKEQLPGSCMDYYTVQNWVDFSNDYAGMTVATPDNPMVQLGDFHFGRHQQEVALERPMLLGWLTNNYWETNFRAHQPGLITALRHASPQRRL